MNHSDQDKQDEIVPIHSDLIKEDPSLADLVLVFVKRLPIIVEEIHLAYQNKNFYALHQKFHDLKSTGGGYGYRALHQLAVRLEAAAKNNDYTSIGANLGELDALTHQIVKGTEAIETALENSTHDT